ncbi:FAD-dependent monooxygenase [Promicromonospora sp. NPDC057488]|uniref:FAD-dependent monooxygenase n=1 Tax=Promicromonospora sp. NPDC057488 TaxID=3346147 RepID=UPI00366CFE1B
MTGSTSSSTDSRSASSADVLIVGAGPAGLTLAADLLRRGVGVRIISAADEGFAGSRAKGIQPRTQEVFDDLGVLDDVVRYSSSYPALGVHLGPLVLPRTMFAPRRPSEAVPYPNTLLVGQYDTDAALRRRVEALGGRIELGTRLTTLDQHDDGADDRVTATVESPRGTEHIRARYLVGADGGGSAVRRACGIGFEGTTDESDRMIVADLLIRGLSRKRWHVWPSRRFLALCPLPGEDARLFQLMVKLTPDDDADTGREAVERRIRGYAGTRRVSVDAVRWHSVWRPNTRLAQHYRKGRVFLVGDAAHVHPPTGAQGLNTGVQDSYNLGWKLGQVLAGAPDGLLDTYEAERRPVAARVLGLATELYADTKGRPLAATTRGDEERQLALSYRGGPLAVDSVPNTGTGASTGGLAAGDRVPDLRWTDPRNGPQRLFDHLRGPHFTLLAVGEPPKISWPDAGAPLRTVTVPAADAARLGGTGTTAMLIRPDGYLLATYSVEFGPDTIRRTLIHPATFVDLE